MVVVHLHPVVYLHLLIQKGGSSEMFIILSVFEGFTKIFDWVVLRNLRPRRDYDRWEGFD